MPPNAQVPEAVDVQIWTQRGATVTAGQQQGISITLRTTPGRHIIFRADPGAFWDSVTKQCRVFENWWKVQNGVGNRHATGRETSWIVSGAAPV